jgi:glycosyltransferase involved in cell wall biosynthesis
VLISLLKVSIVVCTFSKERERQVLGCLESLTQQTLKPHEIILVLDPDPDLKESYSSQVPSNITIVTAKETGLSNARNAGLLAAGGEVVAFIDDDATADRNWLRNLEGNFRDDNTLGVGGYVRPVWENGRPTWFAEELDWVVGCSYRGGPREKCYVRNPLGCNMAFRSTVFTEIGAFRPGIGRVGKLLIGSEEAELSMRLSAMMPRARIVYDPSAVVYHRVPNTRCSIRYLLRRSFNEGVSKALIGTMNSKARNSLQDEAGYLRYLLLTSIPQRLARIYSRRKLAELFAIVASVMLVFIGYSVQELRFLVHPQVSNDSKPSVK